MHRLSIATGRKRGARSASLIMATALVLGAFTAPSAAGKGRGACPKFRPEAPPSDSEKAQEVPNLPVVLVTDRTSEERPLVIEFEQELSVWWYAHAAGRGPIIDGNSYYNVQVATKKRNVGLHARLEWPLAPEELDMYMFNRYGSMVAWSEAFNQLPAEATGDTGGPGFEYIAGYPAINCSGFTIESNALWATPQTATLKLWLGPIEWEG